MIQRLKGYFIACALVLFAAGCGDSEHDDLTGDDLGTETPATPGELSLSRSAVQSILIRDFSQNIIENITVSYGTAATAAVDFALTPWTEQELETYNSENGTNYTLLPSNLYELATTGTIAQGQSSAALSLILFVEPLKKAILSAEQEPNYALPLRLTSESATVRALRSEVVYNVMLVLPTVQVQGNEHTVFVEAESVRQEIATRLMSGNNFTECINPFRFGVRASNQADELIAAYNEAHGTGFELLPEEAYSVEQAEYKAGDSEATCAVVFHRDQMGEGVYLLPAVPAIDEETLNARGGENVCYLKVGKNVYTNPVIRQSAPDPTCIRANDGYYYLYGTEDTYNLPVYRSKNMVDWEYMNTAFTDGTRPSWDNPISTGQYHSLWAPEIRYINGKYTLYYSWAVWGQEWDSEVGVATSDSPTGPFTDQGQVIDAREMNVQNSIDQFEYEDNGQRYLFWGSFHGIYVTELTDDGLRVKRNPDGTPTMKQLVAGQPNACAYEGTCIYKRGNYYYLFASIGSCCEGANSTYQTVVGRSESLFGPYVNRSGRRMLDNQHEILIYANENFVGCGHNSIIQQDDAGQTWIIFHGYVRSEADNGRYVFLNQLYWDEEGWPYVENAVAAPKAFAPVINP